VTMVNNNMNKPTGSPIAMPQDSLSFTFNLDYGPVQNCDRSSKYCAYGSIKWACQATCGSSSGTCTDSSTFGFILDAGVAGDCVWLVKNSDDAIDMKCTNSTIIVVKKQPQQ